jgi:DNA repair exonuclease SbcCD ATPase subunit
MRLRSVTISGFAGISRTATLDLDAGVVILLGSNGFGKTTVCDALTWALTGSHPRDADPRSWYGSGETFVELDVSIGPARVPATIRRLVANPGEENPKKLKTSVIVRESDGQIRGAEAERWIAGWLQASPTESEEEVDEPGAALTDSFYLQQDSLRDFLADRSDDERFAALSQMVGARALSDLVADFDSASRAWTKSVGKDAEDVERLRLSVEAAHTEIEAAQRRLEQVRAIDTGAVSEWVRNVANHLRVGAGLPEEGAAADAGLLGETLEAGLTARSSQLAQLDARFEQLYTLERSLVEIEEAPAGESPLNDLDSRMRGLMLARDQAVAAVEEAQAQLRATQTRSDELRALAELALRHVSGTCPTCGQDVDAAELAHRLQTVARDSGEQEGAGEGERLVQAHQARDGILAAIESLSAELQQAREAVERDRQRQIQRRRDQDSQGRLLAEIDQIGFSLVESGVVPQGCGRDQLRSEVTAWLDRGRELQTTYQAMEPLLAASSIEDRLNGLRSEELRRQNELSRALGALEGRQRTQSIAEAMLKALKRDSENFLNDRLRAIQPILDQLYAAIDPHPTLRSMLLETRNWYGKNRLSPVLIDATMELRVDEPGRTLSTSQANALAVTLFLAFNLGLQPTRVASVILDDPLQNLDDVHLLGLVDLLRRVQPHRQIVVTTHDASFASLLARKMRPIDEDDRLALIRFEAWDRQGPRIAQEHPEADPQPMKLVAG